MTIKDAVELYNSINDKINDIKEMLGHILKQDKGPLNECTINTRDMQKITMYLSNYIKHLEDSLNKEFSG